MNTKTDAIRILCYGDSNTWSRSGASADRYPINVRWTGLLQTQLGGMYEVIEEGLRSRTTDLEDDDPAFPGRNGLAYLRPCLESHQTLDIVVLWLGTNDLKTKFNRNAEDIVQALLGLVKVIKEVSKDAQGKQSQIILVAPPLVKEGVLKPGSQFAGAGEKSEQLALPLKELAQKENCCFVDLSADVFPGDFDGVHLEPDQHPQVANLICKAIKELCP